MILLKFKWSSRPPPVRHPLIWAWVHTYTMQENKSSCTIFVTQVRVQSYNCVSEFALHRHHMWSAQQCCCKLHAMSEYAYVWTRAKDFLKKLDRKSDAAAVCVFCQPTGSLSAFFYSTENKGILNCVVVSVFLFDTIVTGIVRGHNAVLWWCRD